jgi:hypothetical protein
MPNEELDEAELFNQAVSDEPAETPEAPVTEVEQPDKPETEVVADAKVEAEKPVIDDNAPLIPSWRLREIREERDAVTQRLKDAEARLAQQPRVEAAKVEVPPRPDPLLDPEGYAKAVREEVRQEMLNDRREESLQTAAEKYGDEFKQAYQAAQQRIDPALRARMQESRNPGETLIKWHREQKTRAEVGDDLAAYKARLRDEALKDPEFRKAAMEAWRSDAPPAQVNGRPRVELPPTLNGASRANAALRSEDNVVSDAELFREIAG